MGFLLAVSFSSVWSYDHITGELEFLVVLVWRWGVVIRRWVVRGRVFGLRGAETKKLVRGVVKVTRYPGSSRGDGIIQT